jgi:DNA invertase Pin-like site-specific DNA recombinase
VPMSNAAIYARVSSARQKEQETIRSQTVALHTHAEQLGLDVPEQWVFEDDGHSGASLVRPALERLRDLVCQVPVDVLLVYSPDRLARKYAYQALLIEEFAKAGTTVMFVKGPRSDSPEDALLVQFQGMIAEYERAQILERTRRGKAHRAKSGTINVLSGAPFGYRYVRKSEHAEARYEIVAHEAAIVAELFARYADGGVAIGELARWLSGLGVATRTGKPRWDRSTVWGMLRNPAYAGLACFGKTMRTDQTAGLNRTARLAGRATPRSYTVIDRARSDWLEIPVPALVAEDTWQRVQRRLEDNKRYAARNSRNPSLLQGICACSSCGYAYYRTSTRTTNKKIYYYRCLGSDDYRYEHGRVCANKPVRADYLDTVVWNHITALLADPALIRNEINKRLQQVRTADPATVERQRLDAGLAKATTAITRLIGAYQEELISLDELRTRMPELRARQTSLHHQIDALDSQLADREVYLKLADNLEDFLTGLRGKAATATVAERQRVLRLLVKDVLVGAEKITIRHSIPVRHNVSSGTDDSPETDSEGEIRPDCQLRWRSQDAPLRGPSVGVSPRAVLGQDARFEKRLHQRQDASVFDPQTHPVHQGRVVDGVEAGLDIALDHPLIGVGGEHACLGDRVVSASIRAKPVGTRLKVRLPDGFQHQLQRRLYHSVSDRRDGCFIPLLLQSRVGMFGSVVELCWPGWPLVEHGARGHRQVGRGQARLLGVVRRAAGLRCPDSVMRVRHSASTRSVQGMQSRLPGPRRASSLPVLIQS